MKQKVQYNVQHLDERIEYLRTEIVPKIDALIRDGRSKPLPDIYSRLSAEYTELQQALAERQEPASCVGEIADLMYYGVQQVDEKVFSGVLCVASAFGLTPAQALEATIMKYTPRTKGVKDPADEKVLLRSYLNSLSLQVFNYVTVQEKVDELKEIMQPFLPPPADQR